MFSPPVALIFWLPPVSVDASDPVEALCVKVEVEVADRVAPLVVPLLGAVTLVESVAVKVLSLDRVRADDCVDSVIVVLRSDSLLSG